MTTTNSTPKSEPTPTENQAEPIPAEPIPLNLCQGYLVDPITKLHLCNVCDYHKYRNESKPWLK